ncbi:Disheveled-associated activator of morphogenesis 1, partial [Quaeritorhiza haematococci]
GAGKEITFLDSKRSQNCNIMLKAIKLNPQQIKTAVNTADTDTLPRHVLAELLKFVPTEDEVALLHTYSTDPTAVENLASAERFLFEVSEISKYGEKVKALHFKTMWDELVDDAETLIGWLGGAAKCVQNSEKFKELLKVILALGNYMNGGNRGGAYGFKLNSILKMVDTKSTVSNRKHTLLHYLTELLEKKFPNIVGFEKELSPAEDGAKVTIAQIRQVLMTMRDNLRELKKMLDSMEGAPPAKKDDTKPAAPGAPGAAKPSHSGPSSKPATPGKDDKSKSTTKDDVAENKFLTTMQQFYTTSQSHYEDLNSRFEAADKEYQTAVVLYGEDPKVMSPEEFFGTFWKFVQGFQMAKQENETAAQKAIEAEKREAEKREREERRRRKREGSITAITGAATGGPSAQGHAVGKGAADQDQGGLDDLISAIRTGKAFGGTDGAPGQRQRRERNASAQSGNNNLK